MADGVQINVGASSAINSMAEAADMLTYELNGRDLATYFGVMAAQKQRAMNTGRHPSSLPKNSELWTYSKLSTQRRDRIKKGHQFWDVIEEENVDATIHTKESVAKEKEDDYTTKAKQLSFLKGSSINQKLRNFLSEAKNNDMQHLELRVDFKNKNQIYFGMSFIIMNYADEILYVNSKEELRCKPISQIEPSDRIKFKMVDLMNPSNPQPLSFGDTMYLQCLDASETADNSFSTGTVLTSKLFGLPQHSSLNFDVNQNFTTTDSYTSNTSVIPKDIGIFADETQHQFEPPDSPTNQPATPAPMTRRASAMNMIPAVTPAAPTAGPKFTFDDQDIKPSKSTEDVGEEALSVQVTPNNRAGANAGDTTTKTKQYSNAATICGDVHITRICEVRMLENSLGFQADFGLLSDDKAMRYTSKAASLLGKWCVHSAELNSSPTKDHDKKLFGHARKTKNDTGSMHSTKPDKHVGSSGTGLNTVKDNKVYSMSPIFIQQDLYCISTKHPSEHNTWPMRSTAIINQSNNITKETALEYRTAYRESAVVKNSLQARQYNKGTGKLFDDDETLDEHPHHREGDPRNSTSDLHGSSSHGGGSVSGSTSGSVGGNGSNSGTGANSTGKAENAYGCLRKVVKRGPPYDFSVDRRCVWKFCLFEQFSDNNIKLSVKDRAAKKVMETATMAMKLSQLNREGAHTHIQNHTYGEDLPPLKSGESFVRTLREINFKTSMKLEEKYLQMRREKESRLKEHFAKHMTEVREMEKLDQEAADAKAKAARSPRSKSPKNLFSPSTNSVSSTFSYVTEGSFQGDSYGYEDSTLSHKSSVSKVPNLMAKTGQQRRTSFLIDTNPTSVKNMKEINAANASIYSNSATNNNSSANNSWQNSPVHQTNASSRINAMFSGGAGAGPNVRFHDDSSSINTHNYTHGSSSHASATSGQYLSNITTHTTARNVIGTTAARGRNSVTFNFQSPGAGGGDETSTGEFVNQGGNHGGANHGAYHGHHTKMSDITHAAQLVAQSIAALPDMDHKQLEREAQLHLNPRRLLLDNPKSLHLFGELSEGEKVLALHKTFHHVAELALDPNRPRRHSSGTKKGVSSAGVAAKLTRLLEEDKNIKQVLHHKERRERIRNKEDLYEHTSGI